MRLFEFVIQGNTEEARYFISCTNARAAMGAAHRLASRCAVKVFCDGELIGEADHTKWRWNVRRLLQNPKYKELP